MNRPAAAVHVAALLLISAVGAPAQRPAEPTVPDFASLVREVGTAHRPNGPVAAIDSFRSELVLELLDKQLEQGGQVELAVRYLRWQRPGSKRSQTLLHYELRDSEQNIVRGQDKDGPWHMHQGMPQDLTGARLEQDLEQFREHLNLTRQLVRFLSPDDVLRELENRSEVGREKLKIDRTTSIATFTVEGDMRGFPLMQAADEHVHLKVYIDAEQHHLRAVDAWPVVDGKPDTTRGERIVLGKQQVVDDVLVPHELLHLWRDRSGQLRSHTRVRLTRMALRPQPPLAVGDFDRG